jgi:hypothetical protein
MPRSMVYFTAPSTMVFNMASNGYLEVATTSNFFLSSTGSEYRCQLLQQVGFRQFAVGRTGRCQVTSGRIRLKAPIGTTPTGTYLYQIEHVNPTTSSFYAPLVTSASIRNELIWSGTTTGYCMLIFNLPLRPTSLSIKSLNHMVSEHDLLELRVVFPQAVSALAPFTTA